MNKKSKLTIMVLAIASILTVSGTVVFGANKTQDTMNLEGLIRATTNNNTELSLLNRKIELRKEWYSDALKEKDNESGYQEDIRKEVTPFRRNMEIEDLQYQWDQKQDEIILTSTKAYYEILNKNKMIEIQGKKVARLKTVIENKKKKIQAGVEAEYTIMTDEANLKEAEITLKQLQNEKEDLKIKLNLNIGNEVETQLNLKEVEIPYTEYKLEDINKVIDTMLKKSHSITSLLEKQRIDTIEKDIVEDYNLKDNSSELEKFTSGAADFQSIVDGLEDGLLEIKYDLVDEKRNIEAKIRMDYNNILNLQNDVNIKQLNYENTKTSLKVEQAKFKAGQSTQLNCDISQENVDSALYAYNSSKIQQYIATETFKNYIKRAN